MRKIDGENPDWTEDRENYDQVSPLHDEKVGPNYDQSTFKLRPRMTERVFEN